MAEPVAATKSSSSFVIAALKREMEAGNASGAGCTAIHRLAVALQAALVDAGFLAANPPGSRLGLFKNSVSGASTTLTAKYTLPEFVAMLPEAAEEGNTVVLNYSLMPNFVMIYACVPGAQSQVLRLCLELPKLAPLLYLDSSDAVGAAEEKEILELWRVLKDELCLPLMISLCQLNGLPLPPCLMALPDELKDKVLELLPGVDLAKVQCTCKELKDLAADNDLWERKFALELNTLGDGSRWGRNWKKWFEVAWTRKVANSRRQRKRPRTSSMDYGWGNFPPSPLYVLEVDDPLGFPDCSGLYMDYAWGNSPPSVPNFLTIDDDSDRLPIATSWV
jgi:F-box protein 7